MDIIWKNKLRLTIGNTYEKNYFLKQISKKFLKMFEKLLIIGCGLIGSSLLRASINKKLSKKYLVYEKSKNKKSNKKIKYLEK